MNEFPSSLCSDSHPLEFHESAALILILRWRDGFIIIRLQFSSDNFPSVSVAPGKIVGGVEDLLFVACGGRGL